MYLLEWIFHQSKQVAPYKDCFGELDAEGRNGDGSKPSDHEAVTRRFSNEVTANDSLYAYNEIYIDARAPGGATRGVITLFGLSAGGLPFYSAYGLVSGVIGAFVEWLEHGTRLAPDFFICGLVLIPALIVTVFYYSWKYGWPFLRLEMFTARRLIIRFNRVTRKVYLLRPDHLGGIVICDWDQTKTSLDPAMGELEGGEAVLLLWDKGEAMHLDGRRTEDVEIVLIGKIAQDGKELLAFWEYIRRYMEEGPAAAPPPKKLINKSPSPWQSFKAVSWLDRRFFRHSALWVFVLVYVLILPFTLVHALGHWLSLLLCYEPKFPREIEEAGKPSSSPLGRSLMAHGAAK